MDYSDTDLKIQQHLRADNAKLVFNRMAALGRKRVMNWIIEYGFQVDAEQALIIACQKGRYQVVQYLLTRCDVNAACCDNAAIELAARNGFLEIVELLSEHGSVSSALPSDILYTAAAAANLKLVQFLCQRNSVYTLDNYDFAFRKAADRGHLAVVQYLYTQGAGRPTNSRNYYALSNAVAYGQLATVKFMCESGYNVNFFTDILYKPAQTGDLAMVRYLYSQGVIIPADLTSADAATGHYLAQKKWLHYACGELCRRAARIYVQYHTEAEFPPQETIPEIIWQILQAAMP